MGIEEGYEKVPEYMDIADYIRGRPTKFKADMCSLIKIFEENGL